MCELVLDNAPGVAAVHEHLRVQPDLPLARIAAAGLDVNRHMARDDVPVKRTRLECRTNRRALARRSTVERKAAARGRSRLCLDDGASEKYGGRKQSGKSQATREATVCSGLSLPGARAGRCAVSS